MKAAGWRGFSDWNPDGSAGAIGGRVEDRCGRGDGIFEAAKPFVQAERKPKVHLINCGNYRNNNILSQRCKGKFVIFVILRIIRFNLLLKMVNF